MQGAFGIFILDQNHRLRNVQVSNVASSSDVKETLRTIIAIKYSEKYNIGTPNGWQTIKDRTIPNDQVKKNEYYSQIIQTDVPVTADGVDDFKIEELWAGPAVYGDQILSKSDGNKLNYLTFT
jgi:hypothetical protein